MVISLNLIQLDTKHANFRNICSKTAYEAYISYLISKSMLYRGIKSICAVAYPAWQQALSFCAVYHSMSFVHIYFFSGFTKCEYSIKLANILSSKGSLFF